MAAALRVSAAARVSVALRVSAATVPKRWIRPKVRSLTVAALVDVWWLIAGVR